LLGCPNDLTNDVEAPKDAPALRLSSDDRRLLVGWDEIADASSYEVWYSEWDDLVRAARLAEDVTLETRAALQTGGDIIAGWGTLIPH
jgi:hypothetical protein